MVPSGVSEDIYV